VGAAHGMTTAVMTLTYNNDEGLKVIQQRAGKLSLKN
jgi:hypothetical protein